MVAVLPTTSVEREKGFSNLNRIKTDDGNRLQLEHVECLMRISATEMDARTLKFDHSEALIARWKRRKDRRPTYKGDSRFDEDICEWLQ